MKIKLGTILNKEIKRNGKDHLQAQQTFRHNITKDKSKLHPRKMKYRNKYE